MLGHKAGGYGTTEIYAKYDPDYLSKSVVAIDEYFTELHQRLTRPLDPDRLKLRASCVPAIKKNKAPERTKPPGFPEGFDGGAEGNRTPDLYNAISLDSERNQKHKSAPVGKSKHDKSST